jgi:hypothetical protein
MGRLRCSDCEQHNQFATVLDGAKLNNVWRHSRGAGPGRPVSGVRLSILSPMVQMDEGGCTAAKGTLGWCVAA